MELQHIPQTAGAYWELAGIYKDLFVKCSKIRKLLISSITTAKRRDKNDDLMTYDLSVLKVLSRYYSDYEIPGMVYEYMEGVGAWYRVVIPGYNPKDSLLKPFYLKKKLNKEDLVKYAKSDEELDRLNKFYDITKGLVKFSKPKDVEVLFNNLEE